MKTINIQIHRLLGSIDDPVRKMKWQQIQGEVCHAWKSLSLLMEMVNSFMLAQVAQEYDVVKNIMQTLNQFKVF